MPFTFEINPNGDIAYIRVKDFGCLECPTSDFPALKLIDVHPDGRLAITIGDYVFDDIPNGNTYIAVPTENQTLKPSTYAELTQGGGGAFQVDLAQPKVEVMFPTEIKIDNSTTFASRNFKLDLQTTGDGLLVLPEESAVLSEETLNQKLWLRDESGNLIELVNIEFGLRLNDIRVDTTALGLTIFTGVLELVLIDEASLEYPISRYRGLAEALEDNTDSLINIYSELAPKDFPSFTTGEQYLLRTLHKQESANDSESYAKLTITSDQTAEIEIDIIDPINPSVRVLETTYSLDGNSLTLQVEDKTYSYSLFTNSFGRDVTVSRYTSNDRESTQSYLFAKKETFELGADDLVGIWRSVMFNRALSASVNYVSFAEQQRMERSFQYNYSSGPRDFYRINGDDTVSILRWFSCPDASTYGDCEQTALEEYLSTGSLILEQFKFFRASDDELILTRTVWWDSPDLEQPQIGSFGRIFQRVDESHFDW